MAEAQTIFALASAAGRAGVAVFRISGTDAAEVFSVMCKPDKMPLPRNAVLRRIKNPNNGEDIDSVVAIYFTAPNSFTGEDVVELHTHGGRAVINAVTEVLGAISGFRMAEPGEFSRRAFENGKLDLTEAEAIADLVHAETEAQRKQALRQMDGALGRLYGDWGDRLTRILAYMEAAIDFSDEDLPEEEIQKQVESIAGLRAEILAHLGDGHRGERIREGLSVAIIGAPNAGKSSLLNALARRDAAIVSPTAGTTRDVIEVHMDIGGYAVTLADTAGLRGSDDAIESEGIRRAIERAKTADLKLIVADASKKLSGDSALMFADKDSVIVLNKLDLCQPVNELTSYGHEQLRQARLSSDCERQGKTSLCSTKAERGAERVMSSIVDTFIGRSVSGSKVLGDAPCPVVSVSALTGEGMDELLQVLGKELGSRLSVSSAPLTRARHRKALEECEEHLSRALTSEMADMRAEDVRLAMRSLGRITGKVDVEDLLDIVFRDFCVGK